jgi:hypothetical protein
MHMFELFEFGFVFEFELSSLEKIKIKAFRKSLEKEKAISAQHSPVQPSGAARLRRLTGGLHLLTAVLALARSLLPPVSSESRVLAPFLACPRACALSAQQAPSIGASARCHDCAFVSLPCGPCLSAPPPSSNLRSARPSWPRPRPRKSRPLPTCPTPTQTPPSRSLYHLLHLQTAPSSPSLVRCLFPELGRPPAFTAPTRPFCRRR